MSNAELIERLCSLVEEQNAIIKEIAKRLSERDDVDMADRVNQACRKYRDVIG